MTYSPDILRLNPELAALHVAPASKYHNAKTEAAGMTFQSGYEAAGVSKLILLEAQHEIFALRLQVRFPLAGKTVYVADAVYLKLEPSWEAGKPYIVPVVVDFKGVKTKEYKIKKRLFRERYGIDIEEF